MFAMFPILSCSWRKNIDAVKGKRGAHTGHLSSPATEYQVIMRCVFRDQSAVSQLRQHIAALSTDKLYMYLLGVDRWANTS